MARTVMYEPGLRALDEHIADVRHDIAKAVARDNRRYCPVRFGDLRRSIRGPVRVNKTTSRIFVGTTYWRFVEYGTAPHIIRPNTKKALNWPGAPHPVKVVHHPGTKAVAFMRRGVYQKRVIHL